MPSDFIQRRNLAAFFLPFQSDEISFPPLSTHSSFQKPCALYAPKKRNNKKFRMFNRKSVTCNDDENYTQDRQTRLNGTRRNVNSSSSFLRDGFLLRRLDFGGFGLSSGFLSRCLFGQKCRRNVGQHTTLCNGHSGQQFVQLHMKQKRKPLLIVEYEMKWHETIQSVREKMQ